MSSNPKSSGKDPKSSGKDPKSPDSDVKSPGSDVKSPDSVIDVEALTPQSLVIDESSSDQQFQSKSSSDSSEQKFQSSTDSSDQKFQSTDSDKFQSSTESDKFQSSYDSTRSSSSSSTQVPGFKLKKYFVRTYEGETQTPEIGKVSIHDQPKTSSGDSSSQKGSECPYFAIPAPRDFVTTSSDEDSSCPKKRRELACKKSPAKKSPAKNKPKSSVEVVLKPAQFNPDVATRTILSNPPPYSQPSISLPYSLAQSLADPSSPLAQSLAYSLAYSQASSTLPYSLPSTSAYSLLSSDPIYSQLAITSVYSLFSNTPIYSRPPITSTITSSSETDTSSSDNQAATTSTSYLTTATYPLDNRTIATSASSSATATSSSDDQTIKINYPNKFLETDKPFNVFGMYETKTKANTDTKPAVGIIGGTGIYKNLDILKDAEVIRVPHSIYGSPSDPTVLKGKIGQIEVYIMSRHGEKHLVNPSNVNYRANLDVLKKLGCKVILATSACGSLKPSISPRSFIVLDQYIDRTKGNRESSFYQVCHIPQADPFDNEARSCFINACTRTGVPFVSSGTTVTIEGPRFSTKAESNIYRSWDASVVNMTTVPEAPLAAELGLHYAVLGLVTDSDCIMDNPDYDVTVELVKENLNNMKDDVARILIEAVKEVERTNWFNVRARKMRFANSSIMNSQPLL